MKHTIKKLSDTKVSLTITLDSADLAPIHAHTLQRLAKSAKVAGFRPGKVPPALAEKNLDPNMVNSEVLEEAVNHSASDVLDSEKLTPVDRPQVNITKFVPKQELEFVAELEILPEIKLGNYKNLKAKKETVEVTEADIDEVVDRLRTNMSTKADVTRAAKNGDEVVIDFDGKDKDGQPVAGASGKDYPLNLGSNTFIPGFEEGIVGKKAGDNFELPLTFPKDYHHKPLAGAKITFAVTIKSIKEVQLPAADDKFATKAGPFKKLDELRADIHRELSDQKEREAVEKLKDSLIEQLVKVSHVPTPSVLVEDQQASIERDFVQNLMYRGMTLDQYLDQQGFSREDWVENELRPQAERRVKVGLVLAELSKAEAIEITKKELDDRLEEMLTRYGKSEEMTKQLDTPEARRDLANRVITEKTVDRLVDLNRK